MDEQGEEESCAMVLDWDEGRASRVGMQRGCADRG
ncbi:uncharacterized protein G2W53_015649 [Senna tora]|uniref:Uncharacterized protein n=1 Tax=Senna tora TaxID=362788 RepID=A0A834WVL8_9FABA|nr:uncharacterized protein G2W53_015649 [Senna tora]